MKTCIDIDKKYRTNQGDQVIIHTTSGAGSRPVVGQIKNMSTGKWQALSWTIEGLLTNENKEALIVNYPLSLVEFNEYYGWEEGDIIEIKTKFGRTNLFYYRGDGKFSEAKEYSTPFLPENNWASLKNVSKEFRDNEH